MYCDACGKQLQIGQQFCSTCGKAVGIVGGAGSEGRVTRHRQILGILWLAAGAINTMGGIILVILANTLFVAIANSATPRFPGGLTFLHPLMNLLGIVVIGIAVLQLTAGIGLLQKKHWARLITLVAGFIALLKIPFGTALGIYTLWVLLSEESEKEYERLSAVA